MDKRMTNFGAVVLYVRDMPQVVDFYRRALGIDPRLYDDENGFAELGEEGRIAVASHEAGELMMPGAYRAPGDGRVSGVELAFYVEDVAAAYERARSAGATAITAPRVMPWGQTVAYVESPEGTILGFVTPVPESSNSGPTGGS